MKVKFEGLEDWEIETIEKCYKGMKSNQHHRCHVQLWDLLNIYKNQNHKCALSGTIFDLEFNRPSPDRIDSQQPYIASNIQFVTLQINKMKLNLVQSRFIELCTRIAIHNNTIKREKRKIFEKSDYVKISQIS